MSPRWRDVSISNDSGRSAGGSLVVAKAALVASSMSVTAIVRLNHPIDSTAPPNYEVTGRGGSGTVIPQSLPAAAAGAPRGSAAPHHGSESPSRLSQSYRTRISVLRWTRRSAAVES